MKRLILILPRPLRETITDLLAAAPELAWFTVLTAEGHGPRCAEDGTRLPLDEVLGYVPCTRIEVLLDRDHIKPLLKRLSAEIGQESRHQVRHYVTDIEEFGHL